MSNFNYNTMKQEQKDLLLKDLCVRLPYDIKFPITWSDPITSEPIETTGTISDINRYGIVSFVWEYEGQEILQKNALHIKDVKPYLFPMSSMTDEDHTIYFKIWEDTGKMAYLEGCHHLICNIKAYKVANDYLLSKHYDINGLIPMGLANDATGLNIY